MKFCEFTAGEM